MGREGDEGRQPFSGAGTNSVNSSSPVGPGEMAALTVVVVPLPDGPETTAGDEESPSFTGVH